MVALAAFAAVNGRVFLGSDFSALLTAAIRDPSSPPTAFAVWAGVALLGSILLIVGTVAALDDDDVPIRAWAVGSAFAAAALWQGWYLPRELGAVWALGSRGVYFAILTGFAVNLLIALRGAVWMSGYATAFGARFQSAAPSSAASPSYVRQIEDRLVHQAAAITALTGERDRLVQQLAQITALSHDVQNLLLFPGVVRAVRAVLHPDRASSEPEKIAATKMFQTASKVFERIGAR